VYGCICVAVASVGYHTWQQSIQASTEFDRYLSFIAQSGFAQNGIAQGGGRPSSSTTYQTTAPPPTGKDEKDDTVGSDTVGSNFTNQVRDFLVDCPTIYAKTKGQDPNPGPKFVVEVDQAPTKHPFYISLHDSRFDQVRWFIYSHKRYYEFKLEVVWAEILQHAPSHARILDVGGNIGYFSMLSASMGTSFHIDTFEPNPLNLLRACESLDKNQWGNEFATTTTNDNIHSSLDRSTVNFWQLGVSDTAGTMHFLPDNNPGAGRIVNETRSGERPTTTVLVTTLDDFARARGWIRSSSSSSPTNTEAVRIEIMKIDVESHESNVLLGARQLLHQGIIRHILMEYTIRGADRTFQSQALQVLLDAGYTLCGLGNYRGPKLNNVPFDTHDRPHFIDNFLADMRKRNQQALNLWWQIDPACKRGSGIKPDTEWDPK